MISNIFAALRVAFAVLFVAGSAYAQNSGSVTNHAFTIGKGPGVQGFGSLVCTGFAVGTGSGTDPTCRAITYADLPTIANGTVLGNSSGSTGAPSALTTLPNGVQTNITALGTVTTGVWSGTAIGLAKGGTNANLSATGGTSQVLQQPTAGGNIIVSTLSFADISSLVSPSQLPNPSAIALGGVQSAAAVSNQWINSISTSGVPALSQPAFSNISGTVAAAQLPNPSASTLGGVRSAAAVSNQWINSISTSGVPALSQPAFSNISGSATLAQFPTIAANTVLGNPTASTAVPQAMSVNNCLNALTYDTSTHTFGCNTALGTGSVTSVTIAAGLGLSVSGTCTITSSGTCTVTAVPLSKVVATTYNTATASGTQDITGFGFNPTSCQIKANVNGIAEVSDGFVASDATQGSMFTNGASTIWATSTTQAVFLADLASGSARGVVSFITDGIRITWTKVASPTGTADIIAMCKR